MEKFHGVDYYGIDELLTEEQRMMRDAVRDWVEAKFLPIVAQHHRDGTFPGELARDLGEMGVFGATLKGYGCAELDNVAYGLIMQELERGDSGLRSFASVQSGLVMYPIYSYGSPAQKDRWLPRLQSGEALGCFGLTEPDHGSDPGAMKTRAVKKGNEYVLNGTKLWITNGSVAEVAVVWAKGDDGEIGGYLVEKGTPGYSTLDIHGKFSMRASITSELAFADCMIPLDNKLPGVKGLKGPLSCLSQARYGIAWGAIGAAMAVLRLGAPVRAAAHPVRQAHRLVPARAAEARVDDHRDHQGPAPLPAPRPAQGRGPGAAAADLDGQDEQRADGARRARAWPATSWARRASSTSTRSSAT